MPLDPSPNCLSLEERVPIKYAGQRLDSASAELFPDFSRARLQSWIKNGSLLVDGKQVKPNTKLAGGEKLCLVAKLEAQGEWVAEDIPFEVVFEDDAIIVLNKPAGLVVHPAAGNHSGTLLNGLIYRFPQLVDIPRAGIVHRLDKDTSGLMVVAKTLEAQNHLVAQLQDRTMSRVYEAIVLGVPDHEGSVEANIGRHPTNRLKMAVVSGGKPALTHYKVLRNNEYFSHIRLKLESGRTHQIRVHMAYIGFPLVGDPVYGKGINARLLKMYPSFVKIENFPRQALHAVRLGLQHPNGDRNCLWRVPLPEDIDNLLREVFS